MSPSANQGTAKLTGLKVTRICASGAILLIDPDEARAIEVLVLHKLRGAAGITTPRSAHGTSSIGPCEVEGREPGIRIGEVIGIDSI
jgi:hypothetical protein